MAPFLSVVAALPRKLPNLSNPPAQIFCFRGYCHFYVRGLRSSTPLCEGKHSFSIQSKARSLDSDSQFFPTAHAKQSLNRYQVFGVSDEFGK